MALIDDPQKWILRLFEMEEREGRGAFCRRYQDGCCPSGLPLENGERVFGVYKDKYHFTPRSLIIREAEKVQRIPWKDVQACSTRHGEGKTLADLTLTDGRTVQVRVGDLATGWSGRISQLFHQLIERHGHQAALGQPLMSVEAFFSQAKDTYAIAPNVEPHPLLEAFKKALQSLADLKGVTKIFLSVDNEGDNEGDSFVAVAVVVVTVEQHPEFQNFASRFGADEVILADENTIRKVGEIPPGSTVLEIVWD